ncbi:hypothetical protein V2G26_015098 [Clonostachys chloroleuca]
MKTRNHMQINTCGELETRQTAYLSHYTVLTSLAPVVVSGVSKWKAKSRNAFPHLIWPASASISNTCSKRQPPRFSNPAALAVSKNSRCNYTRQLHAVKTAMTKPAVIITCMHRGLGAAPKLIGAGSVTSPTRRCCFATQEAKAKPTASMRLKRPSCWLVAGVSNLLFSVGFQFFRFCPRPRVLVLARLLGRNVAF